MKITKVTWISKSAQEAELIVSDGTYECLAFSQPFNMQLNENLMEPLHAMDVDNLMKVINQGERESIERVSESYFSHHCVAKILSREQSLVSVGEIIIQLENLIPGWAKEGDLVEFNCSRLDIW